MLGPLEVLRSGRAVPLGGPRQRAVLALLLLEAGRAVSMDRLGEDVWGGDPPEEWANTLQTYVFHLRQALEPDRARGAAGGVLVTSGRGYLLRVGREQLDAAVFEDGFTAGRAALEAGRYAEAAQTLRRALGLWRGPVLADLADYAFTRPEAARLEELRLAAVEDRIDADLAPGPPRGADRRAGAAGRRAPAAGAAARPADAGAVPVRPAGRRAGRLPAGPRPARRRAGHRPRGAVAAPARLGSRPRPGARLDRPARARPTVTAPAPRAASPAPEPPGVCGRAWPRRRAGWTRRRARRLLAAGSALAVAAAVCIVVVARPWAGEAPAQLPANTVGLIDSAGGRAGDAGDAWAARTASPTATGRSGSWTAPTGRLFRINPVTHAVVDPIPVGSPRPR